MINKGWSIIVTKSEENIAKTVFQIKFRQPTFFMATKNRSEKIVNKITTYNKVSKTKTLMFNAIKLCT